MISRVNYFPQCEGYIQSGHYHILSEVTKVVTKFLILWSMKKKVSGHRIKRTV